MPLCGVRSSEALVFDRRRGGRSKSAHVPAQEGDGGTKLKSPAASSADSRDVSRGAQFFALCAQPSLQRARLAMAFRQEYGFAAQIKAEFQRVGVAPVCATPYRSLNLRQRRPGSSTGALCHAECWRTYRPLQVSFWTPADQLKQNLLEVDADI